MIEQTGFFSLGEATSLGEENSKYKPVKIPLKIDLASYLTQADRFVNMDMT